MAAGDPRAEAQKIAGLLSAGRAADAAKAARAAHKRHPKEAFFANLAGIALAQDGDHRTAVTWFQKALKLRPGFPEAAQNLVRALTGAGRAAEALALAGRLLRAHPEDAELHYLRAVAARAAGEAGPAAEAAAQAARLAPGLARAHNLLGVILAETGDPAGAIAAYETALRLAPDDPDTLNNIALPLARLGRGEEALAALERALRVRPDHTGAQHRLAIQLAEAGRQEEALAAYDRLLALAPDHPEALHELARLAGPDRAAEMEPPLRAALRRVPAQGPARMHLSHALAAVLRSLDRRDEAARMLAEANAQDARLRPWNAAQARAEHARIAAAFPPGRPLPRSADGGGEQEAPVPIFVLGQMRSGTTLTEQVLSAHPAIFGAGELSAAGRLLQPQTQQGAPWDGAAAERFARAYRAELPAMPEGTRAFVDKMPANYRLIGFLAGAFPNARFVHLTRDPRDVALSIWQGYFPSPALAFTADLHAIAETANLYRRYMNLWRDRCGERLTDLAYEEMVGDIEGASRRLAALAGVAWVPQMAAPELNPAPVRTASAAQVRRPVHGGSVGGWRRHADELAPFLAALDPALWPELATVRPDA